MEWLAEEQLEGLPLPPRYVVISLSENKTEYLNTITGFSSERRPSLDPRTFGSLVFTTARITTSSESEDTISSKPEKPAKKSSNCANRCLKLLRNLYFWKEDLGSETRVT